jgi:DNA-binding NarL/FixJ family response regulator
VAGPIRIVLVEEQTLLLDALRKMLDAEPDMSVVGTATSNANAVSVAVNEQPDFVLLNTDTADGDLAVTVRGIHAAVPRCQLIVISGEEVPLRVFDLVRLGISGYLPKRATHHELKATIRALLSDLDRVTVSLSRAAFDQLAGAGRNPLSTREIEILVMVDAAMTNAQIATQLDLTEATVKRHLRSVFGKLGAVSRIDAVNKAAKAALLTRDKLERHR